MSSTPTKQIDGDISVGRNVTVGGKANVRGSASIDHNLTVKGWLDAPNIKGPEKGLFKSAVQLRESYPNPHEGWWALVGNTLPAQVYMADGGEWVAQTNSDGTPKLAGNPTIDSAEYMEAVEELSGDLEDVKKDVQENKTDIQNLRTTQTTQGNQINNIQTTANEAKSTANAASTAAAEAKSEAQTASSDASGALSAATQALETAGGAKSLAETASATAREASDSAEAAAQLSEKAWTAAANAKVFPFDWIYDEAQMADDVPENSICFITEDKAFYTMLADGFVLHPDYNKDGEARQDCIFRRKNDLYRFDGSALRKFADAGDIASVKDDVSNNKDAIDSLNAQPIVFVNATILLGLNESKELPAVLELLHSHKDHARIQNVGTVITFLSPEGWQTWQFYKHGGFTDKNCWRKSGGSASVGNTYNVTQDAPLPMGFYTLETAVAKAFEKGHNNLGLQMTFAIANKSWKTYQYVGGDTDETSFKDLDNWIDLAGMSAGSETFININELCGNQDYTLSTAVQALLNYQEASGIRYCKEGLVITYRRDAESHTWETKQYRGQLLDLTATNEDQWKDIGGSGGIVTVSTEIEKDSELPVSSGAVYEALQSDPIVNFDDLSDSENHVFQGVNKKGDAVGDPIKIPRSSGQGNTGGSTLNIYPETQTVRGAFGSRLALNVAIKSVSFDAETEIPGTIKTISILDATTNLVLWSEDVNAPSSTSATNYSFEYDFTGFISAACVKDFIIAATDADGNRKTRTITVMAVDVSCTDVSTLNYSSSTALEVGGREKSLPMYKFANNVSTKQGILVTTEMFYDGQWRVLGTATVTDTYSHNISVNPNNLFGDGEKMAHGSYPLRIQGKDIASGVTGNTIYTAIMCVDPSSTQPIVSLRYNDTNEGKIRLYDSLSLDVAAYTPGQISTAVNVVVDEQVVTSLNCESGRTYNVSKQIQGYASDGTKSLTAYACSGEILATEITVTVEGSVIDASVKEGALIAYDFSTRSNSEADHTIEDGGYKMNLTGCNWNSNGFIPVLGETALRIAENVKAEIPYAPFMSSAVETTGAAVQFAFSTKNIKDKNAKLCECYDPATGAGFYIQGNKIVLCVQGGTPEKKAVRFRCGEKISVSVVVEPSSKYVTYTATGSTGGTNYAFVKLYVNGELCGSIGYQPGTGAIRQTRTITFNSEAGDFNLNYFLAYNSYMEWLQAFRNYLCKLSDVNAMIAEYDKENVLDTTGKPSRSLMAAKGIPYIVIVADQTTFNNFDYALNGGTSTSDQFSCTLYYINPLHPEVSFKAINVLWRRQGTTSAQRPIKNDRFNFNKKNKTTGKKATVTLLYPDSTTELGRNAIAAAADGKVYCSDTGLFVDVTTVKIDYSDSSNANDCGVCDMMNATFRALGPSYQTPAQRAFTGEQFLNTGEIINGRQMDHSTKNHPVAIFRATQDTLQDAWFHAKGNWKEDKGEQVALGFKDTPGYNRGCLNYGDFIEFFGTPGETLAQTETRFKTTAGLDTTKVYLISQYCGRDYAFYRYINDTWTRSTGSMKQVNGQWVIEGDVLNPVNGFELLQYAGMDWWQGVSSVEDMMAPTTSKSSWVTKLGLAATTYPAWTYYFECMIDNDQLQEDLALGKKVPYDLFNILRFFDSCDYSKVEGWAEIWKKNAYRYLSLESAMAYTGFTDYLAAIDQRAKNMQPMFYLEDGCSVENGVYSGYKNMEPLRMYLNKIYDCDTCNEKDNDGGKEIDPDVDPNKPTDEEAGYTNPYMGSGSVLFNNIDKQPECWNSNDSGATTISLKSVINKMRNQTAQIDGKTMVPFSPDGAMYFFVEKRLLFWPKVISSYDGECKYINRTDIANMPYFYALDGLGLTSLPRFIEQRWAIRDGYYQTGDFFTNPLSGRVSAISPSSKICITAAETGYFGIGNDASGQLSETVFLEAGESHEFTTFAHDPGALIYIYQPGRMSKIDLSEISLAFHFNDLSKLALAEEIILGGSRHTANTSLNGFNPLSSIIAGDLPFLRILDVSHTTASSIDAKGCPRIESIIASDTPLTSCAIAQTAPISTLTLPEGITALELVNLPNLTYPGGLTLESVSNISRLWIEGCPHIDIDNLLSAVMHAGMLSQIRIPDINITGSVSVLRQLRSSGAIGLDATGNAYEETNRCSGLTGRWIMTELIDEEDAGTIAGLATLKTYFPQLELHNSQFSQIIYNDAEELSDNISNPENGTGYLYGNDYKASGHFKKLEEMSHGVVGRYNSETGVMHCLHLNDDNYNYLAADGSSIDLSDSNGEGYDIFKHIPTYWYKGVNDFKNQQKHSFTSILKDEPISTATVVRRCILDDLLVAEYSAIAVAMNQIGGIPQTIESTETNVYEMNVEGMKQVRWPGVNSEAIGCVFLDSTGKILSTFKMTVSHPVFDFMPGEDYIFTDVPERAVKFLFSAPTDSREKNVIAVDSSSVEAIEPDWVHRLPFLIGVFGLSLDALNRGRSISDTHTVMGEGNAITSGAWTYDENGRVTNLSVPTDIGKSRQDLINVCEIRGAGYHVASYEQSKDVANIIMELTGQRDLKAYCGDGVASGYTNGKKNISGKDYRFPLSSIQTKNINEWGNRTITGTTATSPGNLIFGIQHFVNSNFEWLSHVVVNALSFKDWKAKKCPASMSTYPKDLRWHIYDVQSDTERDVKGINTDGCIGRVRHGRFMDIIAGKTTSDTSRYNKNYAACHTYRDGTCLIVGRGSYAHGASGGLLYTHVGYPIHPYNYFSARLAFSGPIVFDDEVA